MAFQENSCDVKPPSSPLSYLEGHPHCSTLPKPQDQIPDPLLPSQSDYQATSLLVADSHY
jgi:hypothetical protein